jgi:ribosome-associated heat shock protein Hsp15
MNPPPDPVPAATTANPIRVDKWLWMVRVFKTRTSATSACTSGRIRVNDEPAKPATKIGVGDVVEARRTDRTVIYRVVGIPTSRVGAALVPGLVDDLSPPRPERRSQDPPHAVRERGQGRPTKKDRRAIDRLRGRAT